MSVERIDVDIDDVAAWGNIDPGHRVGALEVLLATAKQQIIEATIEWPEGDDDRLPAFKLAAMMLAARWWARRDTPNGVAGFGSEGAVVRVSRFDPDIEALIDPWRHPPLL